MKTHATSAGTGAAALVTVALLALTGCATPPVSADPPRATAKASPRSSTASTLPAVPGYPVGEFPPVPLLRLPDLSLFDSTSASGFRLTASRHIADTSGVRVSPAHCDESGTVIADDGSGLLYGDGSGTFTRADGTLQNFGDGSGGFTLNGVTVQNFGDGSGTYDDGVITIQNFGDGSGTYQDAQLHVEVYGDGSGSTSSPAGRVQNNGDGSGVYDGARGLHIRNHGDGSGSYADGQLRIDNHGDGTASVNGTRVAADPLPPVPKLGSFPPLGAIAPISSCGTLITFEDAVLFDFAQHTVRPDAAETLSLVARVLTEQQVPHAVVAGHTDAIGEDDANQALSERRAASVVTALRDAGVEADLVAEGHGESRPVAANDVNGVDNPAGRQLNRRVEIFIPAAP